mgnify:CR=1 FL=1
MVMRDKNHASIFSWSLGNESYDGDYQEKEVIADDWDMQNRIQF